MHKETHYVKGDMRIITIDGDKDTIAIAIREPMGEEQSITVTRNDLVSLRVILNNNEICLL